ncbi:MAG: alpha/beta hydrolase, partial [Solirubrobacterales bacterium]|nr:alpha/beta hydrolase [Solirubrobacterales bacterium]
AALVIVGPAVGGGEPEERSLAAWDALAAGLEQDGIDGFVAALGPHEPAWRETIERITRERMSLHRDLDAVARALRELPRSMPFGSLEELTAIEAPALVVASHDEADPGHPYAVAEAWAEALPNARLISEQRGSSPLAWQGGQLSREIADFLATDEVAERLSGD